MGIIADFLANATTIDTGNGDGIVGIDRALVQELEGFAAKLDPTVSVTDAVNEVQSLAAYAPTVSGGTFDLDFTLKSGETFSVDDIAYDVDAATLQGAINTAAAAVVGWADDDIVVAGDDLTAGATTFTFTGSVGGQNHPLIVADGTNLTGGGTIGAVSETTAGQTARRAWGVLIGLGLVAAADMPAQQGSASSATALVNRETWPGMPSQGLIKALAEAAAVEDGVEAIEADIKEAFSLTDR